MRLRQLAPVLAAVLLLTACGADDETAPDEPVDAPEAPDTDAGDPDADPGDDPSALEEGIPPAIEVPEVEDGLVRAEGVVVPIPEGWSIDETALAQGLIGVSPGDEPPTQLLLASGGIESSPVFGVLGLDYDQIVDAFGDLLPDGPTVDEDVELAGADRARLIRYDEVAVQEGQAPTNEVLLLAEADDRVALFNYAAASETFDEEVVDLLLDEAGIDPDTEPTVFPQPEAPADAEG